MKLPILLIALASFLVAQPTVTKVEPPSWWPHSSVNPLRLLIRGTNLQGAKVSSDFKASRISVNEKGTYLLVDITIPGNPTAGLHPITIHTRHGDASAPFEILGAARSADAGRKGFAPTDVIYLVM